MLKALKDAKTGKSADGKTVTGVGDFKIGLSKCQTGWSDTEGLTDDSIKIGAIAPLSGTAAAFGNLPKGMQVLLDYYAAKGLFKDSNGKTRKINFLVKDDGYDAARTIPLTDEMLDSEKVFIVHTTGTPRLYGASNDSPGTDTRRSTRRPTSAHQLPDQLVEGFLESRK